MPHDETVLWRFYLSEPRGELRQDYQAAQIAEAIYKVFGGKSELTTKDYLLRFTEPEPIEMTKDKMIRAMLSLGCKKGKIKSHIEKVFGEIDNSEIVNAATSNRKR